VRGGIRVPIKKAPKPQAGSTGTKEGVATPKDGPANKKQ
jgi:hypothetical protein